MAPRALAAALVALVAATGGVARAAPPTKSQLELQKLQQEVRQLRIENDHSAGVGGTFLRWGPFVAVVGGVVTVLLGVRKEVRDNRQQRADELNQRIEEAKQERAQRDAELRQQQTEAQRRFDKLFAQAVANLGSETESVQVSAVVLLENFLRRSDARFHEQVYQVLCANLALDHTPLVNRFLVRAFEKAIRLRLAAHEGAPLRIDLANCRLPRVDLSGLMLEDADFAFATLLDGNVVGARLARLHAYDVNLERARLSEANLTEARMHGAQCRGAQFHKTRLVSAELRKSKTQAADLRDAEFFGASLQGAHLEDADISGAKFDDANLSDAYLTGITYDEDALRSLLRAKVVKSTPTWKNARLDEHVRARLEAMPAGGGRRRARPGGEAPAVAPAREPA